MDKNKILFLTAHVILQFTALLLHFCFCFTKTSRSHESIHTTLGSSVAKLRKSSVNEYSSIFSAYSFFKRLLVSKDLSLYLTRLKVNSVQDREPILFLIY